MGYKLCPICELNYITDEEEMCDFCLRARRGEGSHTDEVMCMMCGMNPVDSSTDICEDCRREKELEELLEKQVIIGADEVVPSVPEIDDIQVDEEAIPEAEFKVISDDLGYNDDDDEDEETTPTSTEEY